MARQEGRSSLRRAQENTPDPGAFMDTRRLGKGGNMSQAANPGTAGQAPSTADHKACHQCGAQILKAAEICPKCGVRQRNTVSKAGLLLLTFFFGGIGAHKFYLGKYWQGALYLIFFWTGIPALASLVEFFIYAFTSADRLNEKYSAHGSLVLIVILVGVVGIFIIGILAAIAIPAYQDYTSRAKVAGVIGLASPWRMAIELHYIEQKKFPDGPGDLAKGTPPPPADGSGGSISLGPNGALTLTFSPGTGSLAGKTMLFRPGGGEGGNLRWDCTGGTLEPRYRPASCRP